MVDDGGSAIRIPSAILQALEIGGVIERRHPVPMLHQQFFETSLRRREPGAVVVAREREKSVLVGGGVMDLGAQNVAKAGSMRKPFGAWRLIDLGRSKFQRPA